MNKRTVPIDGVYYEFDLSNVSAEDLERLRVLEATIREELPDATDDECFELLVRFAAECRRMGRSRQLRVIRGGKK